MDQKSFVSIVDKYFKRFNSCQYKISSFINDQPAIIIVIPSYDEKDVLPTIHSLFYNQNPFQFNVEIIFLINNSLEASEEIKATNLSTYRVLMDFAKKNNHSNLSLYPIYVNDLNPKHAGVGLARKIGMDIALKRFKEISYNGIIVGLDADATVCSNYFNSIYSFFKSGNFSGASIHFEHPLEGNDFSDLQYKYIIAYELHLRYYKNAMAYVGFPYAFHTVGSSFALLASAYARQGGMNKRKAGEDFYFINKLIKGEVFGEIRDAKVVPSPRVSERVPFGTGRAVLEAFKGKKDLSLTYDFRIFNLLKTWVSLIRNQKFEYLIFPSEIKAFVSKEEWESTHFEILKNTLNHSSYLKRFYTKYDAFWVLKFVHFCSGNLIPKSNLEENVNLLFYELGLKDLKSSLKQLVTLRNIDQKKGAEAP